MGSELQRVVDLKKDVGGEYYEVGWKSDVPSFLPLPQLSQFSHFLGRNPFLTTFNTISINFTQLHDFEINLRGP